MVYKYIRYSTDKQDEASQDNIIREYLFRKGMIADRTYKDEGVSGGKKYTQRNLFNLISTLQPGDTIVVSEVSRLTRRGIGELCEIVERYFKPNKLRLIICNVGLDVNCSDIDPMTEMQLYMLATFAKIERNLISERTKAALTAIREEIDIVGYHISKEGNRVTRLGGMGGHREGAGRAGGEKSHKAALSNENNAKFYKYLRSFEERNGSFESSNGKNQQKWEQLAHELNQLGYKTSSGMEFTDSRCRNMYRTILKTLGEV